MPPAKSQESFIPPLWILTIFAVAALAWLIVQLNQIVVLLVFGYAIAYVIHPILSWLQRLRVGRTTGFFVVVAVLIGGLALLFMTALPVIMREYRLLVDNWPVYTKTAHDRFAVLLVELRARFPQLIPAEQGDLLASLPASGGEAIKQVGLVLWDALQRTFSVGMAIFDLILLPFIVFYLAVDFPALHEQLLLFFPFQQRKKVVALVGEIDRYVSAFVRGQLMVCTILFGLYAVLLGLIGVDLWMLLAVISGFGNMIPYFGFLCGIVLSSIMALVTFGDLTHLFWVWAAFGLVQFLEGTFITPRIIGGKVGLSPLVVIISIFAGGKLFGILGVLLAIPGAAVLKVLGGYLRVWALKRAGLA